MIFVFFCINIFFSQNLVAQDIKFNQICSKGILLDGCTYELYIDIGFTLLFQPISFLAILLAFNSLALCAKSPPARDLLLLLLK